MTINLALLGLAGANSSWALVAFIYFLERFRLFRRCAQHLGYVSAGRYS